MTKQTENQLRQRIAELLAEVDDLERVIAGQTIAITQQSLEVRKLQQELRQKNTAISLRGEILPKGLPSPHKKEYNERTY
jgi:hypothetical protein